MCKTNMMFSFIVSNHMKLMCWSNNACLAISSAKASIRQWYCIY